MSLCSSQPLRAMPAPSRKKPACSLRCASGLMTHLTPLRLAAGHNRQSMSNRRGLLFSSIHCPCCRAGVNHRIHIYRVGLAFQKQPARRVRNHMHIFIFRRTHQPLRVLRFIVRRHVQAVKPHHHIQSIQPGSHPPNPKPFFTMSTSIPVSNRNASPFLAYCALIFLIS